MGFREELQELLNIEGAVAASVMGMDGIAIDTIEQPLDDGKDEIDILSLLVEYTNVLSQMGQATALLETGPVTELAVNTERLRTVFQKITDEYIVVLALAPTASFGEARYRLRLASSRLLKEL